MKVTTTPGKKRPTTGKTSTNKKKSEIKTTQLILKDIKEKPRSITPTREKIKIENELNKTVKQKQTHKSSKSQSNLPEIPKIENQEPISNFNLNI